MLNHLEDMTTNLQVDLGMKMMWHGLNGPTDVQQPSFDWTERGGLFNSTSHVGQPNKFNFGYVEMQPKQF